MSTFDKDLSPETKQKFNKVFPDILQAQKEYNAAKTQWKEKTQQVIAIEVKYIKEKGITNDGGSVPERFDDIEDEDVFNQAVNDTEREIDNVHSDDEKQKLYSAENKLISLCMEFMEDDQKETIKKSCFGVHANVAKRQKIVGQMMQIG